MTAWSKASIRRRRRLLGTLLNTYDNQLLSQLASKEKVAFLSACEPITLQLSETLYEPNQAAAYVYFPSRGFVSLIAQVDEASGVEVGMIGAEGMLGAHLALGVLTSPVRALVQGAGQAWRMEAPKFQRTLGRNVALRHLVHHYLHVLSAQLARSSACLRYHLIEQRLAKWLLMSFDRANTNPFHMTQEFLGYMLGVRRVGVTGAAVALAKQGAIRYHRGEVTIVDRALLEHAACSCYAYNASVYQDTLLHHP